MDVVGEIIPERTVRDTTNSIPEVVATFIDWIVDGTLPEEKLDRLIKSLEDLLLEAAGSSDLGGAAASTLSRALSVFGIKGKILNMGNSDSVIDLARVAAQNSGNDVEEAIETVIQGDDGGGEQLTVLLQGILGAAAQFLPGASEASLVVGMLGKVMDSLGYSVDHAAIVVTMFTRYPDRVYHFIRRAFTIASLSGHDVTRRGTQAEIFAVVVPKLTKYFQDKAATKAKSDAEKNNEDHLTAALDGVVELDSDLTADATLASVATTTTAGSSSSGGSRGSSGWLQNLIRGHGGDALQLTAGIASAAYGGGVLSSLVQGAVFARKVYKSHKEKTVENSQWNVESAEMLRDIKKELVITPDVLVDSWILILWLCFTAVLLPSVVGAWSDVEMVARILFRDVDFSFLHVYQLEDHGFDPISILSGLVIFALYVTTVYLLYKNHAFFRFMSPSLLLSILFMVKFGITWFMAFSASNNGSKIFTKAWSMPSLGPHVTMMVSALSTILVDGTMQSNRPLFLLGRFLPFGIILAYIAGFTDASLHIFAMAVGTLGNIMLSHMIKKKRGVKRKIVLWCFDDLLQVMAQVADNTITPDDKLELMTPGIFACSVINVLNEDKMLLLGFIFGLSKTFLPRRWWMAVMVGEIVVVAVAAVVNQRGLEPCWVRWKILLPEHSKRIDVMEKYWRAYLQAKPQFDLKPYHVEEAYGVCVIVHQPWVTLATSYEIEFRKVGAVFAKDLPWIKHTTPELRSESTFANYIAKEDRDDLIVIKDLSLGTHYEVRVNAVGDLEQPPGLVKKCRTSVPSIVVIATSPTELVVESSHPRKAGKQYYIRFKRQSNWTWHYRSGLTALTFSKLVLSEEGKCLLENLIPEETYELQFQVKSEDDTETTEWVPVEPAQITLPSIPAVVVPTDTPRVSVKAKSSTEIEVQGQIPSTGGATVKCYLRCRRGTWPWFYRNGINPLTATKLLLDENGVCVIAGLLPQAEYETQFQIDTDGKLTQWFPVDPVTLTLPSTPDAVTSLPPIATATATATTNPTSTTTLPPTTTTPLLNASTTTPPVEDELDPQRVDSICTFGYTALEEKEPTVAVDGTNDNPISHNDNNDDDDDDSDRVKRLGVGEARVLFDYVPVKDHELAVKKDEIIQVIDHVDANWVTATLGGKMGILPKNHIIMQNWTDSPDLDLD